MEDHEDIRSISKAIEDVLAGVPANVDYPVEVLQRDYRDIQIDSTVLVEDGEAVEVARQLLAQLQLGESESILDRIQSTLVQVIHQV